MTVFRSSVAFPMRNPRSGRCGSARQSHANRGTVSVHATRFGSIAHQLPTDLELMQGRFDLPQSEDCLTLNIWTPDPEGDGCPVMFWIHGGAYLNGSGAAQWFDGTSFATNHRIVVVTVNYRLNALGYLHLADFSPHEDGSGNCGLLDQIAALEWVRDNIAAFGGDPGNVTVFGESAGAMSTGVILGTPKAEGLFHRAILQSGAAANVTSRADASVVAGQLLSEVDLTPDEHGIAGLRDLPASAIMAAFGSVAMHHPPDMAAERIVPMFAPVVDGVVLPREPMASIRSGLSADVPVIIGTNRDEMEILRLLDKSIYDFGDDEVTRRFRSFFGPLADQALAMYEGPARGTTENLWTAVDTDRMFLMPAVELAEARSASGAATWLYLFTWPTSSFGGRMGAVHTLEIPFVFNTLDLGAAPELTGGPPDAARPLAQHMHQVWAQFAEPGIRTMQAPYRGTSTNHNVGRP